MNKKNYILLAGILLVHFLFLMFLKFTAWPEMSLWPYLITKGWLPYSNIAIAHTPLAIFDLAVFYKIFGVGILQLKIFTWSLILLSDILVFIVAKKFWNTKVAFLSLVTYVLWLVIYDGNGFWFDLYMGILAFCSFYFAKNRKWFWTGFFWALAFISKQTTIWFLLPISLEIINVRPASEDSPMKCAWVFIKGVLPVASVFVLSLYFFGIFSDFWDWAVKFGVFILPKAQGQIQLPDLKNLTIALFPFLIFLPLFLNHKSKFLNLFLWAFAGTMGAFPRFEYFHFLPALSFLAIAVALSFTEIGKKKDLPLKIFLGLYLIGSAVLFTKYGIRNLNKETRFYERNVQDTILYVKYNTSPGDNIFVLNYWDNIYALTETVPSTNPWIPQLSWYMEIPGIQEKMVESLKNNPPKLIIYNPYTKEGLSSYTPQKVYDYVMANYRNVQSVGDLKILMQK